MTTIPRWSAAAVLLAATVAATSCSDSGNRSSPVLPPPRVVAIESQTCTRPQPRYGVGTLLADGLALTAAHVVDGELRRLDVDGADGRVVASSAAMDLALVASWSSAPATITAASEWFDSIDDVAPAAVDVPTAVTILTPTGQRDTTVERALTLRVDDVSTGLVHERRALELALLVEPGVSGAPVVDERGVLIGVVTLRRGGTSVSYATRVPTLPDLDEPTARQPEGVARPGECT